MPSLKDQLLKSGLASSADAERAAREKVEAAETAHTDAEETEAAAHGAKARAYPNARLITLAETRSLFDAQADRPQKPLQRIADIPVVIDDHDRRRGTVMGLRRAPFCRPGAAR